MSETSEPKAWPYREAATIPEGRDAQERPLLFETGFGPSGLPHLGTFAEVARTDWVRRAFEEQRAGPTELYAFSDDMDGMRGVPLDMPDPDALKEHLGKPLSQVPDPFGEHESFAGHMNAKLREFLDSFGFEYTFKSSQECYRSGTFDDALRRVVERYDEVRGAVTRTLSEEHAADWSPFQPICASCGRVTTTRVVALDREAYELDYACDRRLNAKLLSWEERERGDMKRAAPEARPYWIEKVRVEGCGYQGRAPITGGACKVGWKVDWAMRWYAFGVDYEMYGKDLIDSAKVSAEIVRILGGSKPAGMAYEWFNDEHGGSISKTKGNGLSVEQWLRYGPTESLAWFVFQNPKKAKKLYFGTIPDSADRYLSDRAKFGGQTDQERRENPVWFVDWERHKGSGEGLEYDSEITYSLLLNLVGVLNTDDRALVWDYVRRYDPQGAEAARGVIEPMIERALAYYRDFVAPSKRFEAPPPEMSEALEQFVAHLEAHPDQSGQELQSACYAAGKENGLKLGAWFKALYKLILGQDRGPRVGTFARIYGPTETAALIRRRLAELKA